MEHNGKEFIPTEDRILVRPIEQELENRESGVVLLAPTERPGEGIVLAVGPGAWGNTPDGWYRRPMTCALDDVVLFGKFAGQKIELNGEELLILREADILMIAFADELVA